MFCCWFFFGIILDRDWSWYSTSIPLPFCLPNITSAMYRQQPSWTATVWSCDFKGRFEQTDGWKQVSGSENKNIVPRFLPLPSECKISSMVRARGLRWLSCLSDVLWHHRFVLPGHGFEPCIEHLIARGKSSSTLYESRGFSLDSPVSSHREKLDRVD